ncbi:hypothetical protein FRE64_00740 [Euhalothece natronophila Z-M001]|uniref:Uncharacterized protein n=1 Tax=Euhalothece natronophila Z-M001 TaxID=522448 RepID=A0A5B8NI60_9CHRO|nr:hypothetical protein [Euhalothece natronophila]QDZ38596.1 hypothetical protein FRE64_00740 [Euhalothece natronophila Z-M001]
MSIMIHSACTKDLREIQARMAALVRGIKTRPENALDYGEALEFQLFQLSQLAQQRGNKIQARMAALVRGIKTRPENALDYGEALELQLFQLGQTIEQLDHTSAKNTY